MSHMEGHLLPIDRDSHNLSKAVWAIGEPGPDIETPSLIDLTDAITERLDKAEAITRLLISDDAALEFLPAAAWAIADLIREARELYKQQWERVRSRNRRDSSGSIRGRKK